MRRIILTLSLVVLLLTTMPGVARAEEDQLLVSLDGKHWATAVREPLLDPDLLWVPGDQRSVTVYARNNSNSPASLKLDLADAADRSPALSDDVVVTASTTLIDGTDQPVSQTTTASLLDTEMEPATTTRVVITVTFDPESRNQSQGSQLVLALEMRLVETVPSDGQLGDQPSTNAGLANTGSPSVLLLLTSAVLIVAGAIMIGLQRSGPGLWKVRS